MCTGIVGWIFFLTQRLEETTISPATLTTPYLTQFSLVETFQKRRSKVFVYESSQSTLKIETIPEIDTEAAKKLEESGIVGIEALYASALSPYPGDISKEIVVDERYHPRFVRKAVNGRIGSFYILFASKRFGLGAGTADTVRYKALVGWIYCEDSRDFYRLKYFGPLDAGDDELEALFASCSCSSNPRNS